MDAQSRPRRDLRYVVRFVIDGDTVDLSGAGRVRLLGIDAPEVGRSFETSAPFAVEARDRLASLLITRWVRLEGDDEERDGYGRLLAYVIRDDGLFVNADLLRMGLARVSARRPLRRLSELRRAEEEAQRARRGIWGGRPSIPAPSYVAARHERRRRGERAVAKRHLEEYRAWRNASKMGRVVGSQTVLSFRLNTLPASCSSVAPSARQAAPSPPYPDYEARDRGSVENVH